MECSYSLCLKALKFKFVKYAFNTFSYFLFQITDFSEIEKSSKSDPAWVSDGQLTNASSSLFAVSFSVFYILGIFPLNFVLL